MKQPHRPAHADQSSVGDLPKAGNPCVGTDSPLSAAASHVGEMQAGQKVFVNWGKRGWLPGVVEGLSTPDPGEDFQRVKVAMDNGFCCQGSGYHPACVVAA